MIVDEFKQEKQDILDLADSMATAAADFRGHNYELLLKSREKLKQSLDEFETKILKNN